MKKVYSAVLTVVSAILSVVFLLFLAFFPSGSKE